MIIFIIILEIKVDSIIVSITISIFVGISFTMFSPVAVEYAAEITYPVNEG